MPELRTAEEWASYCQVRGHGPIGQFLSIRPVLCVDCVRTYRLHGVIGALERARKTMCQYCRQDVPYYPTSQNFHAGHSKTGRLESNFYLCEAAAIQALKPEEFVP